MWCGTVQGAGEWQKKTVLRSRRGNQNSKKCVHVTFLLLNTADHHVNWTAILHYASPMGKTAPHCAVPDSARYKTTNSGEIRESTHRSLPTDAAIIGYI